MAETGVAIAAARVEAVAGLKAVIEARRARAPETPFPWATLALDGTLEHRLRSPGTGQYRLSMVPDRVRPGEMLPGSAEYRESMIELVSAFAVAALVSR